MAGEQGGLGVNPLSGRTQRNVEADAAAREAQAALDEAKAAEEAAKATSETDQANIDANAAAAGEAEAAAQASRAEQAKTDSGTYKASDGTIFTDYDSYTNYQNFLTQQAAGNAQYAADKTAAGQSAWNILYNEFSKYGLGSLVDSIKGLITNGAGEAEMSLALQNTDAYKKRFAANEKRIAKGLAALKPAEYIAMEDQYQNIMRNYGLPNSYYAKGELGRQPGFEELLANDVSATELEDRVATAQQRVLNANPEVLQQLRTYYPDITNGDVLAYALDPKNALSALKRKVTAAEIGGAAAAAGLSDSQAQAEQLAAYGVTGQQAQQQYGTIAELAQRGSQLASIYGEQPYGQAQAEQEVFNLAGQTAAQKARKKLTELEKSAFSGSSGTSQNALSRDRQMSNYMLGVPGAGAF